MTKKRKGANYHGLVLEMKGILSKYAGECSLAPVVDDYLYFIDHYDPAVGRSHQRNECQALCLSLLDSLAFNLPIMISEPLHVPERYVRKAKTCSQSRCAAKAKAMWKADLRSLLHAVEAYRLYRDYELIDHGQCESLSPLELKRRRTRAWRILMTRFGAIGADLWG